MGLLYLQLCVSLLLRSLTGIPIAAAPRRIILPSVARTALQYFPTISHKRYDLPGEKVAEHKMCVLIFCTTFV